MSLGPEGVVRNAIGWAFAARRGREATDLATCEVNEELVPMFGTDPVELGNAWSR